MGYQVYGNNNRGNLELVSDLQNCFLFSNFGDYPNEDIFAEQRNFVAFSNLEDKNLPDKRPFLRVLFFPPTSPDKNQNSFLEDQNKYLSLNSNSTLDSEQAIQEKSHMFGQVNLPDLDFLEQEKIQVSKKYFKIKKNFKNVQKTSFCLKKANYFIPFQFDREPIRKVPSSVLLSNLKIFRKGIKKYQQKKKSINSISLFQASKCIEVTKVSCCSCKNSQCLKMYCECFKTRGYCVSQCRCVNCKNNKQKYPISIREFSFNNVRESSKDTFRPFGK